MSVRGKDFRCELDGDLHEQLRVMAEHQNKTIQALGTELLEKAIVGEFHVFRIIVDRLARSGILRNRADGGGILRKIPDNGGKR